ncbi:bifunctional UDP-N-acetylglucosamine diphosphorylase/glucosamine-1-phosphate N-acetyltransferase GlmU [Tissierella sp.]|uniref:bifunctional UDP-N-acetylglucosamine diphosphorylase/glucosamine-1-phosphate N-acetyltransferase GlmU n=1 Tax=Tissierella sp. TaxID=41274 RepID=UPI002860EB20|nr:bifunctional UDP-N-acetylglucosamine diphosphorylase/glucosamine-1-phosphate N-acetyltransferase GlmU [Tissierella sp.]MDR7855664.1 bifunctional UDP-N-acetylglucosamine diphosphorylase/glucosamine-1-phosphate N-acetyltransferase GlmU [Tissierella sp.]
MNISIILAAGEGTRMKSKLSKVLHKVCGKPILEYVIDASKGAAVEKNIVIVGHGGDMVKEYFKDEPIVFKTQPIGDDVPYGTGYAVMQAVDHIEDNSTVIILYGDTPLITENTINNLMNYHNENEFQGTVLTALLDNPTGYGRIIREENGHILKIVEERDASEEEKKIKEINSGIYCFNGKLLKYALGKIDNNNAQKEYYATDVIGILKDEGYKVGAFVIADSNEIHGVNSRVQLASSEEIMRKRINNFHMVNGVSIIDPNNTYIEDNVKIGRDTVIYPGVTLEGNSVIGEDCIIRHNSRIINSTISNGVEIESSTIEESYIGDNTHIGPYAHLRPHSNIGKNVKIGNFVEVKNSTVKDETKAGHLAYIGDADIGHNVNIGCGVIFVNYNGKEKFRTMVGDHSFIGSNSNLVAPVKVNDWGYVAAGSTITKEVPEASLSIERSEQKNINGWVEKKGYKNYK